MGMSLSLIRADATLADRVDELAPFRARAEAELADALRLAPLEAARLSEQQQP